MAYRTLRTADRAALGHDAFPYTGLADGSNDWLVTPAADVADAGAIVSGALSANTLYALPFTVPLGGTVTRTQIRCTTLGSGALARVGIYRATSLRNVYPLRLVKAFAEFDLGSTGRKSDAAEVLLAGGFLYWLAYLTNSATAQIRLLAGTGARAISTALANVNFEQANHGLSVAQAYGALPDPFPSGGALTQTNLPLVSFRLKR